MINKSASPESDIQKLNQNKTFIITLTITEKNAEGKYFYFSWIHTPRPKTLKNQNKTNRIRLCSIQQKSFLQPQPHVICIASTVL